MIQVAGKTPYEDARDLLNENLKLAAQHERSDWTASTHVMLADIAERAGDADTRCLHARQAISIQSDVQDSYDIAASDRFSDCSL